MGLYVMVSIMIVISWALSTLIVDCFLVMAGDKPIKFGLGWVLKKIWPDEFIN